MSVRMHNPRPRPRPRHNPPRVHRFKPGQEDSEPARLERQIEELLRRLLPGHIKQRARLGHLLFLFEQACRREGVYWQPPAYDTPVCMEEAVRKAVTVQLRTEARRNPADALRALLIGFSVLHGKERTEPLSEAEQARSAEINDALRGMDFAAFIEDGREMEFAVAKLNAALRLDEIDEDEGDDES